MKSSIKLIHREYIGSFLYIQLKIDAKVFSYDMKIWIVNMYLPQ
jgi:hypothetical protein